MSIDQITQQALSLPTETRLQLLEALLDSFEPADQTVSTEWRAEAERRRNDIRDGLIEPIPGEEALAQVRALLGK